ncbi:hypothetical protein AN480_04495 [Mycobacterium intracellulare subsp. chimaera]|uniref:Uncharacterized protein n=1 Tax=Mycobacterium asiaticum TaxID=1790 RepID=A0A1A3BPQ8_MYCAS|nr:hypothetical protein AN480_04495 [Mycobacterium intracellulare subsp. chimaera]OBI76965.1 hypothetical protein A9X01_03005 [Mycobacterium asiaticum]
MIAVAHHQAAAVLSELVGELLDVGVADLGLQRRGLHLAGTIADDLIQQRPMASRLVVGLLGIVNYGE